MISYGRNLVLSGGWWATTFAGLTILLTVLALNILAEGLTDAMVNPKLRKTGGEGRRRLDRRRSGHRHRDRDLRAQGSVVEQHELDAVRDASGAADRSRLLQDRKLPANPHAARPGTEAARRRRSQPHRPAPPGPGGRQGQSSRSRTSPSASPAASATPAIVDNVSFTVREGETMGLVGESGCGKSITSLAVMGLLPKTAKITGSIKFDGKELLPADPTGRLAGDEKVYEGLRGEQIAMVYQDALSLAEPVHADQGPAAPADQAQRPQDPEELLRNGQARPGPHAAPATRTNSPAASASAC